MDSFHTHYAPSVSTTAKFGGGPRGQEVRINHEKQNRRNPNRRITGVQHAGLVTRRPVTFFWSAAATTPLSCWHKKPVSGHSPGFPGQSGVALRFATALHTGQATCGYLPPLPGMLFMLQHVRKSGRKAAMSSLLSPVPPCLRVRLPLPLRGESPPNPHTRHRAKHEADKTHGNSCRGGPP